MDTIQAMAKTVRATLTRLGYAAKRDDGSLWEIAFKSLSYYEPGDAALIEVDVHRLPRKVTTLDLTGDVTLHELSTALDGLPVKALNTRGLVYAVQLSPPPPPVRLPRRVDLDLATRPDGEYQVPLGVGRNGPRWASLLDLLNVLVGGQPGSGKSMLLSTWLAALTTAYGPAGLRLTLIDPKRVELAGWRGLPHLAGGIATTSDEAGQAFDLLLDEVDRRARAFATVNARGLVGYNRRATEPLPLHLVVIDELTDLAIQAGGPKSDLWRKLLRAASTGRALGILFVMATQSPRSEIVNGNLKAVLNTRIAFRVPTSTDSQVILDRPDAARLPKALPGRMVAITGDKAEVLQGYCIDDAALAEVQTAAGAGAGAAGTEVPDLLTDDERWVARIALHDLGGAFKVDAIYSHTGPAGEGGVSYRWLCDLARRWEARGWLSKPVSAAEPRRVTPELAALLSERPNTSESSDRPNVETTPGPTLVD
jgi:hypothetical protein